MEDTKLIEQNIKNPETKQQQNNLSPIDKVSIGLLEEFTGLKDLEEQLKMIVINQQNLLQNMASLNDFYSQNEDLQEVQLMMKKLNLYRMKLKKIRSDMLYIRSTSKNLLQKAINIQDIKVNQKADRVKNYDYEISLIARRNQ
ncbi:hypothetical protein PVAND_015105 [Polypedilum vanderplanki]|uniref:Biogenesis of lysosome-related organelles complex 1 subunit 6 n=1 Tax=Polypedilum vanderplanki TaxID=319348 RepID=A0A9J6BBN1_POLVA|nr:hypothetical protein PVAND_015105 [Polypedilum vanderplanki]